MGQSVNTGVSNNADIRIVSDVPVYVSHGTELYDAVVLYPATTEDLYGVGSTLMHIAAGVSGADVDWERVGNSPTSGSPTIASQGVFAQGRKR